MVVKKAGCILIDKKAKKIGIVYRQNRDDYSFPKGHLDDDESLVECAIRETKEETGRICEIVSENIYIEKYITSSGENVEMYYYIAVDKGNYDNTNDDSHDLVWVDFDNVEDILSYPNLKLTWSNIRAKVLEFLN